MPDIEDTNGDDYFSRKFCEAEEKYKENKEKLEGKIKINDSDSEMELTDTRNSAVE